MQEDLPTTCDLSPSEHPGEHMAPQCSNADHAACAKPSKLSTSACSLSLQTPCRLRQPSLSGSVANFDSSSPLPESSSPLPSASSVMAPPLSTMSARKQLIGDSSCLSFDFACSCTAPECRANKASPQQAVPSGTGSQARMLVITIGCLLLLSTIISQFVGTRHGNYAFSLTSKFGRVEGDQIFVSGGQPVIRYLGIPFAVPPVDKLRFQPSQVAEPLAHLNNASFKRRINFAERARPCPQDGALVPGWLYTDPRETSEDCLYLNLWTPDKECLFQGRDCGSRAVIVFFHGGDLRHDGNNAYDGAVLASRTDAVVAVPNYRLGLLGHSAWNESEFVSLGLGDQLTAVRWLRENVGFFGGNASRLVLAGHGAGAASVGHWMLSTQPEISDVQRFIMISGSPYARYMKDADVITKNMRILARRVQCESYDEVTSAEEILPCLRRFPSSVLVPRLTGLNGRLMDPSRCMDDISAAHEPSTFGTRRSLLLGITPDEGYHFVGRMATLNNAPYEWMHRWLTSQGIDNATVLLNNYQRELGTANTTVVWTEAYADVRYRCPVRRFAERMASSGLSVHWFVFDAKPSFEEPYLRGDEAGHYTTVRLLLTDLENVRTTDEDVAVRESFVMTFGLFANTGRLPRTLSGKEWPSYTSSTRAAVRISRHGQEGISMSLDPCRHVRQHEGKPTTAATTEEEPASRAALVQPRVLLSAVSTPKTALSSPHATVQTTQSEGWFDDRAFVRHRSNAVQFETLFWNGPTLLRKFVTNQATTLSAPTCRRRRAILVAFATFAPVAVPFL